MLVSTRKVSPRNRLDGPGLLLMPAVTISSWILPQRFGPQLDHVVLDRRQSKSISSCQSPMPMMCRKLRWFSARSCNFIVIQIAAQACCRQYRDFPVGHAAPSALATCAAIDIVTHQSQQLTPQIGTAIKVLQRPQDGYDLIPTIQIQFTSPMGRQSKRSSGKAKRMLLPP